MIVIDDLQEIGLTYWKKIIFSYYSVIFFWEFFQCSRETKRCKFQKTVKYHDLCFMHLQQMCPSGEWEDRVVQTAKNTFSLTSGNPFKRTVPESKHKTIMEHVSAILSQKLPHASAMLPHMNAMLPIVKTTSSHLRSLATAI